MIQHFNLDQEEALALLNILLGAALLFFGRRLFWLFVAGVGFMAGLEITTQWFGGKVDWMITLIALGVGLVGAFLSLFLQRLAVAIAGFLAGAYLLSTLAFNLHYESLAWIAFFVGGALGAILVALIFDWALVLLSTLTGATMIVQSFDLAPAATIALLVVLLLLGLVNQARQLIHPAPTAQSQKP